MSQSPIIMAMKQLCEEKNLPFAMVVETVEAALAAAYRKDFGELNQNIKVELDQETGEFQVFDIKTVVEDRTEEELLAEREEIKKEQELNPGEISLKKRFNPKTELMISEALKNKEDVVLGETIKTKLKVPEAFGRMAAQTAKQVVIQKLREAERMSIFEEFKTKQGEIIYGIVQRRDGNNCLIDLGKTTGILLAEDQIPSENYIPGKKMKFFVVQVNLGTRNPEIRLSRSHPDFLVHLFKFEIPEIKDGAIEILNVAREAGFRSKISVRATVEGVDPIGSCVGQRGSRIQMIITELNGEKIDIIEYHEDPRIYVINALAPAKVGEVSIDEKNKIATVTVNETQLSLAIGRSGQNVRLAAKLTGWKINIKEEKANVIVAKVDDNEKVVVDEDVSKKIEEKKD